MSGGLNKRFLADPWQFLRRTYLQPISGVFQQRDGSGEYDADLLGRRRYTATSLPDNLTRRTTLRFRATPTTATCSRT
jgi:hypothetical protein